MDLLLQDIPYITAERKPYDGNPIGAKDDLGSWRGRGGGWISIRFPNWFALTLMSQRSKSHFHVEKKDDNSQILFHPIQASRLTMACMNRNVVLVTKSHWLTLKAWSSKTGFEIGRWLRYEQTWRFLVLLQFIMLRPPTLREHLCIYFSLVQNLVKVLKLILNLLN